MSVLRQSGLTLSDLMLSVWRPRRRPRQQPSFPLTGADGALGLIDPDVSGGAP